MDPSALARVARHVRKGAWRLYDDDPVSLIVFAIGFCMLVSIGIASSKPAIYVIAGIAAVAYAWRLAGLGRYIEDHEQSSTG